MLKIFGHGKHANNKASTIMTSGSTMACRSLMQRFFISCGQTIVKENSIYP